MELEQDHYDVVVIGTGLAESIAAASLANSGKSVLHLDPNEYYGSSQASLTLDELERWLSERGTVGSQDDGDGENVASASASSPTTYMNYQRHWISSASSRPSPLPQSLAAQRRQYALSLYPTLLPSRGSLIQTLIDSGVSKYVGFRLLDGVSVWEDGAGTAQSEGSVGANTKGQGKGKGKAVRVPGSKEEVFKDKSVSLVDKRRLMRFLMFVGGEFEADDLFSGKADVPIIDLLTQTFTLPRTLAERVAFAISHCSSLSEPSLSALTRTRRFLRSIGRYGPSAFLVGQYGGAGEIAQGFCRACAVKGGTYVLGDQAIPQSVERLDPTNPSDASDPATSGASAETSNGKRADMARWRLSLPCHPRPITASHIITTPDHLSPDMLPSATSTDGLPSDREVTKRSTMHGIAILPQTPGCLLRVQHASPEAEEAEGEAGKGDDTGVILFPPTAGTGQDGDEGEGLVRALVMGEGTGSCPSGQYIVYLSRESTSSSSNPTASDPKDILQPYLHRIHPEPLYEAYYTLVTPSTSRSAPGVSDGLHVIRSYAGSGEMTQGLDWAAEEGKRMWEDVMGRKVEAGSVRQPIAGDLDEQRTEGEGEGEDQQEGWWAGMGEQGDEEEL